MLEALQGAGRRAGAGAGGRHTSIRSASAMNRSVSAASNSINTCEPVRGQRDATRRERGRVRTTVAQHAPWEVERGPAPRITRSVARARAATASSPAPAPPWSGSRGAGRGMRATPRRRRAAALGPRHPRPVHCGGARWRRHAPATGASSSPRQMRTAGLWHCTRHTPAQTPVRPV
jgi:hypothetical protein